MHKFVRSTKVLLLVFIIAACGVGYVIYNEPDNPLKELPEVLISSIAPLMCVLAIRIVYNMVSRVHSVSENAGRVATWVGLLVIGITSMIYNRISGHLTEMTIFLVLYLFGFFFILVGDILRHYESYQRDIN